MRNAAARATLLAAAALVVGARLARLRAQSLDDTLAVVRAAVPQALEDARRQRPGLRSLMVVPGSTPERTGEFGTGDHLLARLVAEGQGLELGHRTFCPWGGMSGGTGLALALTPPRISGTEATLQILLSCAGSWAQGHGRGFTWAREYRLRSANGRWSVVAAMNLWIA
jgi:hypothetical protein